MPRDTVYLSFFIDCESTQPQVKNPALGERAIRGFADVLEARKLRGTFHVIPGDAQIHAAIYRDLAQRGHEIGLHLHPAAYGKPDFLGLFGPDEQRDLFAQGIDLFTQALRFFPKTVCPGYLSTNDFTYGVLHGLGFRHGTTSFPTRTLAECASVHATAPLDVHYAHPFNKVLPGDGSFDFVELPPTVDPESRMWGGKHPQDWRVELVDAKNHRYTADKAVKRQVLQNVPVKMLRGITHNIFEYGDPKDFRRQTLEGMLDAAAQVCEAQGLHCVGATGEEIAKAYRAAVPAPAEPASAGGRT
jgi:peptidoglycan/xylan/chitin deacetylase (PgdA/CDA1 family)